MKLSLLAAHAGLVVTLQAEHLEKAEMQTVVVYFENTLAPKDMFIPTNLAEQMFASAGVRVIWRTGAPTADQVAHERPIMVVFSFNTPATNHPGALAFSLPTEGIHIKIFYDRVQCDSPILTKVVLAHVLVHEITHILQGIARHSESGVMKAHWTAHDYRDMVWKPLAFTPEDVALIHTGLAVRKGDSEEGLAHLNPIPEGAVQPQVLASR